MSVADGNNGTMETMSHLGFLVITAMALWNHKSCAKVHELPQSHCEDTSFSWFHIYYVYLALVRFEQSVCRGSLMTNYI